MDNLTYNPNISIPKPNGVPDFTKSINEQPNMMGSNMNPNMMNPNMLNPGIGMPNMDVGTMGLGPMNPNMMNPNMMGNMMGGNMNPNMMNSNMLNPVIPGKGGTPLTALKRMQNTSNAGPSNRNQNSNGNNYQEQEQDQNTNRPRQRKRSNNDEEEQEENDNRRKEYEKENKKKIKSLVNNINNSLDDFVPSKSKYSDEEVGSDEGSDEEKDSEKEPKDDDIIVKSKVKKHNDYMPDWIKEPLLIIIIYVIFSQSFVRKTIGQYITQINPNESGSVSIVGYIIYGAILALVFMVFKKLLI